MVSVTEKNYSFSFSLPEIKSLSCIPRPPPSTNNGQSDTDALTLLLTIAQRCVLVKSPPVTIVLPWVLAFCILSISVFLDFWFFSGYSHHHGHDFVCFQKYSTLLVFQQIFHSGYNLQKVFPNLISPEHKKKAFKISMKRNSVKLLLCALHQCHYPSSIQWAFQQF